MCQPPLGGGGLIVLIPGDRPGDRVGLSTGCAHIKSSPQQYILIVLVVAYIGAFHLVRT